MIYIGIDPGKNGAVAVLDNGKITVDKCPETVADMVQLLSENANGLVLLEHVHSMPKQGVASTFTFGQNYGEWLGILAALNIPHKIVTPQKWQKLIGVMPKEKSERKKAIQASMQRLYPTTKITLYAADAVALASVAKNFFEE